MKKISDIYKELRIAFKFPIQIRGSDGNKITAETDCKHSNGYWCKQEYDSNGNETYYENSDGYWRGISQSQSCDGEVVEIEGHFVWT